MGWTDGVGGGFSNDASFSDIGDRSFGGSFGGGRNSRSGMSRGEQSLTDAARGIGRDNWGPASSGRDGGSEMSLMDKVLTGNIGAIEIDPIAAAAGLAGSMFAGPVGGMALGALADYLNSDDIALGDIFSSTPGQNGSTFAVRDDYTSGDGNQAQRNQTFQRYGNEQAIVDAAAARAEEIFGLANNSATGYLGSLGLTQDKLGIDHDPLTQLITQGLEGSRSALSMSNFNDRARSVADDAIGTQTGIARSRLGSQVDELFPQDFSSSRIPDTMDDAIIESLIGSRFEDATGFLDRAMSRGQLAESGYGRAYDDLLEQRTASNSRLQDLGLGVLDKGRQQLSSIGDEARQGASSFELGSSFDPNTFTSKADNAFSQFSSGLEGSILSALGSDPIFNPQASFSLGASSQSAFNPTQSATGLTEAIRAQRERQREDRGIGNQGAF